MKRKILLLTAVFTFSFLILSFYGVAQTPNWIWVRSAGQNCNGYSNSIAVDASGNTYITGYFYSDTLILGSITLTNIDNSGNTSDLFIAKYDANGNVLWAESTGGLSSDGASSIAVDKLGSIYVAGWFYSPTINLGSFNLTNVDNTGNTSDLFLAKYDTNGNVIWAESIGGTDDDAANSIALDNTGNIFLAGNFYCDTLILGANTLVTAGNDDIFITKLDTNGNVIWAKSAGGTDNDLAYSVATDASWNTYVAGGFYSDTLVFGSYTLTNDNAGYEDIFLAKYDNSGNVLWAKSIGGANDDVAYSVVADESGNEYLTGCFRSPSLAFDANILTNNDSINGTEDIFLAKYTTTGNVLWAKSAGGTSDDDAFAVAVDTFGNTYLTGRFNSPVIKFGTDTLTNFIPTGISSDIFLAKYNTNGNVLWAKSAGGTDDDIANSVTVDAPGDIYLTGDFLSTSCTFGMDNMINDSNKYEIFISKLNMSTGINELINLSTISVYPNPATDYIQVSSRPNGQFGKQNAVSSIEIYNFLGEKIYGSQINGNSSPITINISSFPSGSYVLKMMNNRGAEFKKFVKD
jgi:hypothetical protein